MLVITPLSIATSPVNAGAPLPSTILPFRITKSCIASVSSRFSFEYRANPNRIAHLNTVTQGVGRAKIKRSFSRDGTNRDCTFHRREIMIRVDRSEGEHQMAEQKYGDVSVALDGNVAQL